MKNRESDKKIFKDTTVYQTKNTLHRADTIYIMIFDRYV